LVFNRVNIYTMKLSQTQLDLIKLYQSQISAKKAEASTIQEKLDAFVTGIMTATMSSSFQGVTYSIQGDELIVNLPEPISPVEE
jgi:hypothetical protein